jgi:hypothetical protein
MAEQSPRVGSAVKWFASIVGAAVIVAIQTPPDVAASNAALWVKRITGYLPDWPQWVDGFATGVGALLLLTPLIVSLWRKRAGNILERHKAILLALAEPLARLQELAMVYGPRDLAGIAAAQAEAEGLVAQIPYDQETSKTVRDFINVCRMLVSDFETHADERENRQIVHRLSISLFRYLHAGRPVKRRKIEMPDWMREGDKTGPKAVLPKPPPMEAGYRERLLADPKAAALPSPLEAEATARTRYEMRKLTGGIGDPVAMGARLLEEDAKRAPERQIRALAKAVLDEADQEHERAVERLSALLGPRKAAEFSQAQKEGRHALIDKGRDIVTRFREERPSEPFETWARRQREYLDIQPQLGDEYQKWVIRNAERGGSSIADGEFLRELARLEKEWGLT